MHEIPTWAPPVTVLAPVVTDIETVHTGFKNCNKETLHFNKKKVHTHTQAHRNYKNQYVLLKSCFNLPGTSTRLHILCVTKELKEEYMSL